MRIGDKTILQARPAQTSGKINPNFDETSFDAAIQNKGYEVVFEKALSCPCKGRNNNHPLPNCKNCGGTGWVFVNPTRTRMVVQSMSLNPQFQNWGVMGAEISSITARVQDKLSYMDRVTVLDARSEYSEVLYFASNEAGRLYAYTIYKPLEIYVISLFQGVQQPLRRLEEGTDFEIEVDNRILLSEEFSTYDEREDLSATIRYLHNPSYHIIEMVRDTMTSKVKKGRIENDIFLPIHARAKRADVIKDLENYRGDRLFDNSFLKQCEI